jgi:hypothetical protein
MNRTLAGVIAAVTAGGSIWLAGAPAHAEPRTAAAPSARLWLQPHSTYTNGGRFAVMAWCSGHTDLRVVISSLLPGPVSMRKTGPLEVKVTGATKPGSYTVALWCVNSVHEVDALDEATVTIMLRLKGWKQHWQSLPPHFRPTLTVNSGPPPKKPAKPTKPAKKGRRAESRQIPPAPQPPFVSFVG